MSAAEAPSGATEADATQVDTATFGPPRYEGDKRPPFAPGNTAAVTHGAKSPRTVQPVADRLEAELAAIAPWTASEAFTGARRSWAWAEAQAALLRTHVDTYGPFDAEGQETGASKLLDAVEKRLDRARRSGPAAHGARQVDGRRRSGRQRHGRHGQPRGPRRRRRPPPRRPHSHRTHRPRTADARGGHPCRP